MTRPASDELLPAVLRRAAGPGTPLGALCATMDGLLAPADAAIDDVDAWFDPYRAPDRFVAHLAIWVGLGHLLRIGPDGAPTFEGGTGRLRLLVAEAASLAQTRGTAAGLLRTLMLATGEAGFRLDESSGRGRVHLVVHVPLGAEGQRDLVARIVDADRPAYLTYEIASPGAASSDAALPPPLSPPSPNPP